MPPDGSVGEEHEENAVLSQGIVIISRSIDRCCFLNRSSLCLFLRPSIYFFSSPPIIFPRPQLNFPPKWRSSEDDEVSVSILGKSEETARAFDEMNVLLYFVHVFESMCAFGGGKRKKAEREAPFFSSISNDSFEAVYLPP